MIHHSSVFEAHVLYQQEYNTIGLPVTLCNGYVIMGINEPAKWPVHGWRKRHP